MSCRAGFASLAISHGAERYVKELWGEKPSFASLIESYKAEHYVKEQQMASQALLRTPSYKNLTPRQISYKTEEEE